jgi:MYXO-CTERM domain-containing protein
MWLARAVPVIGVAAALAGSTLAGSALAGVTPAVAAVSAVDVAPVLASTPFASPPGQRVTHTITLSPTGAGALTAVRVTFTTTVDLDGVTANPSIGSCPIVTALTVVCELGDVDFAAAGATAPVVTVAGTVHPGAAPGTLVQNLVNVTSGTPDGDPTNNVASNAYLVAGGSPAPTDTPSSRPAAARPVSGKAASSGVNPVPVIALVALAGLAAAALVAVRRRRRSS